MSERRKTKIICTLGPSSSSAAAVRELVERGMNVARLNMSHAKEEWVRDVVGHVRAAAREVGREVSVMMDLRGPSIRTGDVAEPVWLERGMEIEFLLGGSAAARPLAVAVNYPGLGGDVKAGDLLLLDGGVLQMRVVMADADRVVARVEIGGELGSRRHINLPGVSVGLPALTRKDIIDVDLACSMGGDIDFVALSFARDGEHIRQLRAMLDERGSLARIVAKIENHQGIANLDAIIEASDAVMVARGDLGIECELEELPVIQRRIIERCSYIGRKVIVATEMLESMTNSPVPTRAEITDVFNAVMEQVDAVMLSGETAVGKYPGRCVDMLDRIARRTEAEFPSGRLRPDAAQNTDKLRTASAATGLANSIEGSKLMVFTKRGVLGHLLAHQRPERAPIFAFSPKLDVVRSLNLARAVVPFFLEFDGEAEEIIEAGLEILRGRGLVERGDAVVLISDVFQGEYEVDSILWRRVGGLERLRS